MTVTYCVGDMFTVDSPRALAHGCNCAGAMGKGIAVIFRKKWPAMYSRYKELCKDGFFSLGDVFEWNDGITTIYNLGTQKTWKTKADILAIRKSLEELHRLAIDSGVFEIYMPRIGAGLGGLDWSDVKKVIESVFGVSSIQVYVCEDFLVGAQLQIKN
ncbi:MAG: macro domain-containing protein [Pseudomonas sp.]|uniref:macro domain-containing protein n=1 Tax=Pseudomonas sp. TaxID=306 RepID=UPI0033934661